MRCKECSYDRPLENFAVTAAPYRKLDDVCKRCRAKGSAHEDYINLNYHLKNPDNRNEDGSLKDGVVCPFCSQPRLAQKFFSKKKNTYMPACLSCRQKTSQAGLDA